MVVFADAPEVRHHRLVRCVARSLLLIDHFEDQTALAALELDVIDLLLATQNVLLSNTSRVKLFELKQSSCRTVTDQNALFQNHQTAAVWSL